MKRMHNIYLILGASSDLGLSLIKNLNDQNNKADKTDIIVAHYYSGLENLKKLKNQCNNIEILLYQADLSDLPKVKNFICEIKKAKLYPTHIVNFSADMFHYTRLTEWDSTLINRDMTIQVYAFAEILKEFLPEMVKRKYGKIVAMLSAYTFGTPPKNLSGYVTVKFALLGLIKSIASDYGSEGINANGVSPGMINTKFINGVGRKIKEITAETSLRKRLLEVEDVIPTVLLLLSDQAEYINGSNINLTGKSE